MAEDGGAAIKTLRSVQLPMEPACLEFCPAHPEYLVIGSWHLVKEEHHDDKQTRGEDKNDAAAGDNQGAAVSEKQRHMGRVDVYQIEGDQVDLVQSEEHPESAIWDLQFQRHDGRADVFATGSSAGTISIYRVSPPDVDYPEASLHKLSVVGPISADVDSDGRAMITKCCWHPAIPDLLAVSTLAGEVHLINLDSDHEYYPLAVTKVSALVHTEPAWSVALSPQVAMLTGTDDRVFTVYSGGDDMAFRYASIAMRRGPSASPGADSTATTTTFDDALFQPAKKSWHMAGVVSILPLSITLPSDGSQVVITGSYDDNVRVCAVMPLHETFGIANARVLAQLNLGGAAWRLRVMELITHPSGRSWKLRILAPCMSTGSRVLEICGADNKTEWTIRVLGSWYEEAVGTSMLNYGSDVQPKGPSVDNGCAAKISTCVSTSFYSKTLCLWRF